MGMSSTAHETLVQLFRTQPELVALLRRKRRFATVAGMALPAIDIDEADPRAPSEEIWNRLTQAEREAWIEALPASVPFELYPPEGDMHSDAKDGIAGTLRAFYRRTGRRMYISKELATYYPGKRVFCPDVLVVDDVDNYPREKWVVSYEGRGLDLVIEIYVSGDRRKDFETNVARYAQLGIREYFAFDRKHMKLSGFRLPAPSAREYVPIVPASGRYTSKVLLLDLVLEKDRIRFYSGTAALPEADELIERLEHTVDDVTDRAEQEAARADAEAVRADTEAVRADAEAVRADAEAVRAQEETARANELERRLAAALAELEKRNS